jgi:hypothetical protein
MRKDEFEARYAALVREAGRSRDNVGCVQCTQCEGCQGCTFCRESTRLVRSHYCVRSTDCTDCSHCHGCSGCLSCVHCVASERCAQSAYLVRCVGLTGCTYCFGCVGLNRKDFHILNEPYDRKTYFALTQALAKDLRLP